MYSALHFCGGLSLENADAAVSDTETLFSVVIVKEQKLRNWNDGPAHRSVVYEFCLQCISFSRLNSKAEESCIDTE